MNKKIPFVLITILLIACLVVILLLLPKKTKEEAEDIAAEAQTEEEAVDIPVEPEELHLELSLSVNMGVEEIISGFPIVFTATLRNLSSEEALRLENLIVHYSEKASAEEKKNAGESLRFWKARLAGIPAAPVLLTHTERPINEWITIESLSDGQFIPLSWPSRPLQQNMATRLELGKNRVHLEYLVPEETTKDIAPGDYKVRAKLCTGLSDKIEGETASAAVPFKLLSPKDADEKTLLLNHYIAGNLYLRHENYAGAEEHAQQMLMKMPERIDALILLGQAKEGQGNTEQAEKIYIKALNLFASKYPDESPPVILIEKTREALLKKTEKIKDDTK